MDTEIFKQITISHKRHYASVMTFVVVALMVCTAVFFAKPTITHDEPVYRQPLARSMPVQLRIQKINVDTSFEAPLALNADQTVSVPDAYDTVGWYVNGATPGEVGPSVILGHVDSYEGPAVFYSLGQLQKGDRIEIDRADGTTAVFIVDELIRYNQDDFPTERVYGPTDKPELRLVTCTGVFNAGKQRYSHNLVVYGSFAGEKSF
jgi:sortase (surface protein transpeptidase)